MKTSLLKKAALVVAAAVMCFSIPGCGKKDAKAEYIAAVQAKYDEINKIRDEAEEPDMTDADAVTTAGNDLLEQLTPLYTELGSIEAPEELAETQAIIKEGCDASIHGLELSIEGVEIMLDPAAQSDPAALSKLMGMAAEIEEVEAKIAAMDDAIAELIASAEEPEK